MYYIKSDYTSKIVSSSNSLEEAFSTFKKMQTKHCAGTYKIMMEDEKGLLYTYYYLYVYQGNIKLESLID